jgi:hypothetical protein
MANSIWESIDQTLEKLTAHQKLKLIERLARSLGTSPAPQTIEQKREALDRLGSEMACLPVANPADGFSGRDHDQLLYGEGR